MAASAVERPGPPRSRPLRVAGAQPPAPASTVALLAGAVVAALYLGREVFVPLALAVLLGFALSPIVTRLRRLGLGRAPSVLLVVALALGLVSGFAWLLVDQAASLARDLPGYEHNLRQKVRVLRDDAGGAGVFERTADMLRRMAEEVDGDPAATGGTDGPARTSTGPGAEPRPVQPIPVEVHEPPETPLQSAREVLGLVAEPLATAGILVLFVIFVLLQREDLRDRVIRLFGSRDVHRTTEAMSDAAARIGRYLLMQLLINSVYGALFGAGLWLIGVPNPLLWGLIGVVLRFVPFIGAPISLLFPLVLSLAAEPGWTMPLLVLGLFLAIEGLLAYGIEPLLYGSSTGLSPAAVVVATGFWTVLWGPVGLLLATPLTACLVVVGRHVPQLEFLEVVLGNREVLAPSVRLYQRLLADDPGEALEVAEEHAKEGGLVPLLEGVVLPALALVEADRRRGAVDRERERAIAEAIVEIVEEVAEGAAPPRDRAAAVLCLGARGSLDGAAACLLAAALREAGLDAALVAPLEAGGPRPEELPRDGVRLLCVVRVGGGGGAGAARAGRAARRLRARFGPDLPVLVGLWDGGGEDGSAAGAAGAAGAEGDALARELGVARVALTLGDAVEAARGLLGEAEEEETPAVVEGRGNGVGLS